MGSHRLEDGNQVNGLAPDPPRQHRPTTHNECRDIQPHGRHQHAGNDLITVRYQHEPIKRVSHGHDFDRIGNQFPTRQGVAHPLMIHGNAVADADSAELDRGAAGKTDPRLHRFGNLVEVDMSRNDFIG